MYMYVQYMHLLYNVYEHVEMYVVHSRVIEVEPSVNRPGGDAIVKVSPCNASMYQSTSQLRERGTYLSLEYTYKCAFAHGGQFMCIHTMQ